MLEANIKIVNLNLLTPKIKLAYTDFIQIEIGIQENAGYFVFQAKSKINGEIHHIRAFNLNSLSTQQNTDSTDKATTIFLQETLRLCSLNPEAVVLDTFEFYKNKICYAIKPIISPVITTTPRLDISRLLEGLIADLKCVSKHGDIHLPAARICQIGKAYAADKENRLPWYFMQDWNQILWETSMKIAKMESHSENQNKGQLIDTSLQFAETNEKGNIYQLALSLLEISGLKRNELQSLLINSGSFYSRTIYLVLEDPKVANLNLTTEEKELLLEMLNGDASKRPSLEEILVRIKKIQANYKENLNKLKNCSTVVDSNTLSQSPINIAGETRIIQQISAKNKISILEESKSTEITEQVDKTSEINKIDDNLNRNEITVNLYAEIKCSELRKYLEDPNPLSIKKLELKSENVDAEGATALSENTSWTNLTTLDLFQNNFGDEGATILSKNTSWTNLTTLNLQDNNIGAEGATALSKNTLWTNLTTLDLFQNNIGAEGAAALSKNTSWTNLATLDLQDNNIGAEGATALSKNTSWTNLTTINLWNNKIDAAGATALSKNTSWKNLTTLHLGSNNIGAEGATALSKNTSWTNLTTLDLRSSNIGAEGATALSKNTSWKNLTTLNLRSSNIGAEGAIALSQNNSWKNLSKLNLRLNYIGAEGATALSKNNSWKNLTELDLCDNKIGAEGATVLSKNTSWNNLTTLTLFQNNIDAEGAKALSQNTSWTNLTELTLCDNKIGAEGATALSKNISWTNLTTLDLRLNYIGDNKAATIALKTRWPTINLKF